MGRGGGLDVHNNNSVDEMISMRHHRKPLHVLEHLHRRTFTSLYRYWYWRWKRFGNDAHQTALETSFHGSREETDCCHYLLIAETCTPHQAINLSYALQLPSHSRASNTKLARHRSRFARQPFKLNSGVGQSLPDTPVLSTANRATSR